MRASFAVNNAHLCHIDCRNLKKKASLALSELVSCMPLWDLLCALSYSCLLLCLVQLTPAGPMTFPFMKFFLKVAN